MSNKENCQHTWPSLDKALSRKCMRCGVSEQEVFDQHRAESLKQISEWMEDNKKHPCMFDQFKNEPYKVLGLVCNCPRCRIWC